MPKSVVTKMCTSRRKSRITCCEGSYNNALPFGVIVDDLLALRRRLELGAEYARQNAHSLLCTCVHCADPAPIAEQAKVKEQDCVNNDNVKLAAHEQGRTVRIPERLFVSVPATQTVLTTSSKSRDSHLLSSCGVWRDVYDMFPNAYGTVRQR